MTFSWLKGHGTLNDFILLPDPDGDVHRDLAPAFVAALCHRRRGIGADGVLRVVRTSVLGEPAAAASAGEWFMDYRNADGTMSEMCGNGVRVFARHLVDEGLVDPSAPFVVGTRDGDKLVTFRGDEICVDLGSYEVRGMSSVEAAGRSWKAQDVRTGNPHAVAFVDSLAEAGTLMEAPVHDTDVYPEGVNVEFVERVGERHVAIRVHERGSGETQSCGTGACASAIATALADGAAVDRHPLYRVDVPGGTLHVEVSHDRVSLIGPAEIVARGELEWLA